MLVDLFGPLQIEHSLDKMETRITMDPAQLEAGCEGCWARCYRFSCCITPRTIRMRGRAGRGGARRGRMAGQGAR